MRLPKFRLFDYTSEGKGVDPNEPPKTGLALFWDIITRRFWKFVSLNFVYLLFSIPALVITWFLCYIQLTLHFSSAMLGSADNAAMITLFCTFLTIIIYTMIGGGAPTAAMTYVMRNYREDRHAWMWADFISKLRSHLKIGTLTYIIDTVFLFLLGINFWFYSSMAQQEKNAVAFILAGLMGLLAIIYSLMHCYIYPIMISFDLRLRDIYKYSFILAMGKLPITAAAFFAVLLFATLISYLACYVIVYAALLVPILLFTFSAYINLFITYPTIKKYIAKKDDDGHKNSI